MGEEAQGYICKRSILHGAPEGTKAYAPGDIFPGPDFSATPEAIAALLHSGAIVIAVPETEKAAEIAVEEEVYGEPVRRRGRRPPGATLIGERI